MHGALGSVLVLLTASIVMVLVFRRLGLPSVLGYLLVGVLLGPHALGVAASDEGTRYLAEFGVVFLMFTIGLEFSLHQLMAMKRLVFGLGGAQVLLTLLAVFGIAIAVGQPLNTAVVLAGAAAMSSTAIVSKALAEALQLTSAHGKRSMGVLLFQDIAVVPLLILVPALNQTGEELMRSLAVAVLKAIIALVVVLILGERLMRFVFARIARTKSSELFVLVVLLVVLGLAFLTEQAGLSLALGAFVAGILISETEYRYQVEDYVKPFRDVFLGLFFVTLGALLDLSVVLREAPWVLATLAAMLVIKFGLIFALTRWESGDRATAIRVALALAPAGEFGLVLLALAGTHGALAPNVLQIVLAAGLISMLTTPLLLTKSEKIVLYFCQDEWMRRAMNLHALAVRSMDVKGHVLICGYGRSGQAVARFLEQEKLPFIAIDADPERVREAAAAGDSVVFGDASRFEVLTAAGLARATAVVVSVADTRLALSVIEHVRAHRHDVPIVVRTHDDHEIETLRAAGATEIVPEIVEGSLMLATHTMLLQGVPLARVLRHVRTVRDDRYQLMRGFFHGASDAPDAASELAMAHLHSVALVDGARSVGRTIDELALDMVHVEVRALRRRGFKQALPSGDTRLEAGDVLVLLGGPSALAQAEAVLLAK